MKKEYLIALIKWTMLNYGSDAKEKSEPGSKLQSQAEYIASVIDAYETAVMLTSSYLKDEARHIVIEPNWPMRKS